MAVGKSKGGGRGGEKLASLFEDEGHWREFIKRNLRKRKCFNTREGRGKNTHYASRQPKKRGGGSRGTLFYHVPF